jgi:uroporphyrinogen-III synthase
VISERIAEYADELGCEAIYVSDQPSDAALLKTVCEINRELLKAQ